VQRTPRIVPSIWTLAQAAQFDVAVEDPSRFVQGALPRSIGMASSTAYASMNHGLSRDRPKSLCLLDGLKRQVWKRDSIETFIQSQQPIAASLGVCPN
jgi:hypothetical protein